MRSALPLVAVLLCSVAASAADWLTYQSTYTHDPISGQRVAQYAAIQPPVAPMESNFRSSGYTHTRSSLNYGQSADNYHRVEQWGDPVRPYGEWRFPYRPYSSPYPAWGPPYAGLNLGFGGLPYGGDPRDLPTRQYPTQPPPASPLNPYPAGPGTPYPVAPYYDGYYPVYRD